MTMGKRPQGDVRCQYDAARDLMLFYVPHAITRTQMKLIAECCRKQDHARWLTCNPGDRKDIFAAKVKALDAGRYMQVVYHENKHQPVELFKSTQAIGERKIFIPQGLEVMRQVQARRT